MTQQFIKTVADANDQLPVLREPVAGRWYCGMTSIPPEQTEREGRAAQEGELMRCDGEGCWTNEQEDPDGREPNPSDYDWLQEQH